MSRNLPFSPHHSFVLDSKDCLIWHSWQRMPNNIKQSISQKLTSTSSTFEEECEYKNGWQIRLNLVSPSHWTKTSKAKEGGEEVLHKAKNRYKQILWAKTQHVWEKIRTASQHQDLQPAVKQIWNLIYSPKQQKGQKYKRKDSTILVF